MLENKPKNFYIEKKSDTIEFLEEAVDYCAPYFDREIMNCFHCNMPIEFFPTVRIRDIETIEWMLECIQNYMIKKGMMIKMKDLVKDIFKEILEKQKKH